MDYRFCYYGIVEEGVCRNRVRIYYVKIMKLDYIVIKFYYFLMFDCLLLLWW